MESKIGFALGRSSFHQVVGSEIDGEGCVRFAQYRAMLPHPTFDTAA